MAEIEVGELFADRYEIVKKLGRGGMGVVYLAKDWRTEDSVALKTLLPKYSNNKQAVLRFQREVNASRKIQHPCVVKIFDAGKKDGVLYYTMEFLEGKSVRMWMRERKKKYRKAIGLGSTIRILSLLCSALEQAHKFTIHRDLSPENVMVMKNGDVKLLDFGLAKLTSTDQELTRVGVSLGKIQYCSPEQRVDAKSVDHRADIYSLGVMFYEMLSGELPLDQTPLTERVPNLPPETDAFIARAMAEHPDERFNSVVEFQEAMMAIYEHAKAMQEGRDEPTPAEAVPTPMPVMAPVAVRRGAPPKPHSALDPLPPKRVSIFDRFRTRLRRILDRIFRRAPV